MASHKLDQQPEELVVTEIKQLRDQLSELRTLQRQSSQALRVEVITGYTLMTIPDGTLQPSITYIDFEIPEEEGILIATLLRSTFVMYTDLSLVNADLEAHEMGDDSWDVWLSYDGRTPADAEILVPTDPVETIEQRVLAAMADTSIPYNKARVGIRAARSTEDPKPAGLNQYLVIYQIRATIG